MGEINLLYGSCGSGKTETAQAVSKKTGLAYISVGDITRAEIAARSELGNTLKHHLETITEYPPTLIGNLMFPHMARAASQTGGILDGYPKYPVEAEYFVKQIVENQIRLGAIAIIHITYEVALKRLKNRRICNSCLAQSTIHTPTETTCPHCHNGSLITRPDDTPSSIKTRYTDYQNAIKKVLDILSPHIKIAATIDGQLDRGVISDKVQSLFTNQPE